MIELLSNHEISENASCGHV